MNRAEWIQQATLRFEDVIFYEDFIDGIVKIADTLEKSGAAPWDNARETVRDNFVRGTEVGQAEAKKICAEILQKDGVKGLAIYLNVPVLEWVADCERYKQKQEQAVQAERVTCAQVADEEMKRWQKIFSRAETTGKTSKDPAWHEAAGAANVAREIRDAILARNAT